MKILVSCLLAGAVAGQGFEPPRLRSWSLPDRPPVAVIGGGEVLIELAVGADGAVAGAAVLRDTQPFTDLLRDAVRSWHFDSATEAGRPLGWPILVAGVFRPPVLAGAAPGTPSRDTGTPCSEIPFPEDRIVPPYPATAMGDSLVLVEVTVETDGNVSEARVVQGPAVFAQSARDAARGWRFRPACRAGRPVPAVAYVVFGFRSPISSVR